MPLQATSGAASYDAFGGGVAAVPKYIEDYFSTYLVTGDGTAPAVNNGIDLSTKGGLVWIKKRSAAGSHSLFDTARGANLRLISNDTAAQDSVNLSFTTTGFSNYTLDSGVTYASWSWAKAPKFFDVVTYTGNGTAGLTVNHNLGSVPGCIIVKSTTATNTDWQVYHQSLGANKRMRLNTTDAVSGSFATYWNSTSPTSTQFTLGDGSDGNTNGATYVAYLFAHDAGGFGLSGTDNVISCGSYTGNGSTTGPVITLGYEPQWLMVKKSSGAGDWVMLDNMRGIVTDGIDPRVWANLSSAENTGDFLFKLNATGFQPESLSDSINASSQTYIYIAIRRGPMKVPTLGTTVFSAVAQTDTVSRPFPVTAGFPVDLGIFAQRAGWLLNSTFNDRLRGPTNILLSTATTSETFNNSTYGPSNSRLDSNTQFFAGGPNQFEPCIYWMMRRAPSFFDEVCYTGTGVANTAFTHNLTVTPELMIVKPRSAATAPNWRVWSPINSTDFNLLQLSTDGAASSSLYSSSNVFPAIPTATTFTVGGSGSIQLNQSGQTFVAYLFSTCAGVSKVGSFTGNGSSQTINCGFTGGARFVMIKATSTTGDWMVADSARGIVSGSDPYLELNNTNAEVTGEDWLDTDSTGFVVNEVSGSNANTNGVTYIFLAIA